MIFDLFKTKPTLKELIPEGFVDIHSHILPGIDDGAKDVDESLELIFEMKKLGFSKIIGTPHTYKGLYDNTNESIKNSFKILKNKFTDEIKIDYASEYILNETVIEKAKNKNLLCLKDKYVLVEMSFMSMPIGLYEILYEIKVNGYIPILAHPERYMFMKKKDYFELKKFGCLFQANLLSVTDYYGVEVRKNLDILLENNLINFFGSDIHNKRHIKAFDNKVNINKTSAIRKVIENNCLFS